MKLPQFLFNPQSGSERRTVVTFTGGMGAQIISATVYFFLKNRGDAVFADLTYFDRDEHVAAAENPGDCSHWAWQLDRFGISLSSFDSLSGYSKRKVKLIEDGREKLELGLKALRQPEVQKCFEIPRGVEDILPSAVAHSYLCIHVRRGDYVNVASYLVPDRHFIELSAKFAGLVESIVVVSDSPLETNFRNSISSGFDQAVFLDNIDAFATHRVMRNARILICSNSQFSLIAAMLNSDALVIMPKQWFGDDNRALEEPISEACDFQILA
jgi:hypothetical protein